MFFSSWLRARTRPGASEVRRTPKPARRQAAFCPRLEVLEGRCLPSTLTVTSPKDHGPGTLRAEIAAAHANDVIVFSPKLDGHTITLTTGELDITKNLTIQGPGAGQLTISGDLSRVFEVDHGATVTLSGLTITGGVAPAGGGIFNSGTLTVSGCTISSNLAVFQYPYSGVSAGGGIYNAGTLTVSGCSILGNEAYDGYGGGIYNAGTATVSGCTLSGNFVDPDYPYVGGAIYNAGPAVALTVLNSTFISFNGNGDNIYGPYTNGGGNTFK
jgi:hypothetical protein